MIYTCKFNINFISIPEIASSFRLPGETGNVIVPKDPSITRAGGAVMTDLDKQKLQFAYGE